MSEPTVLVERAAPLATLTLNRPDCLNAVSFELYQSLIDALSEIEGDPTVKAIVLRGGGRGFCAGADLKAPRTSDLPKAERRAYARTAQRANLALRRGKPVVAAVHGFGDIDAWQETGPRLLNPCCGFGDAGGERPCAGRIRPGARHGLVQRQCCLCAGRRCRSHGDAADAEETYERSRRTREKGTSRHGCAFR